MLILDFDQFLDSTGVLPILQVLEWGFQLGISQFCTNLDLNCLFVIIIERIYSVGKIIYCMGGQFWAMGRFNLLDGQNNLLGGQMPTQLTYYLPPWCQTGIKLLNITKFW